MSKAPDITLASISTSIAGRTIFSGVDLELHAGQMLALTGASGSGKTTLLNGLGTIAPFSSGSYTAWGKEIMGASARQLRVFRRDKLGYLFQNYALVESENVQNNILSPLSVLPKSQRPTQEDLRAALREVGLEGREKSKVYQLSGGEQQRVALAGLLLKKPALILADEPTGALDSENARMVMDQLRAMTDRGAIAVIATHSDYIASLCDRRCDMSEYTNS